MKEGHIYSEIYRHEDPDTSKLTLVGRIDQT